MGENEMYLESPREGREPGSVWIGALLFAEGLSMVALSFLLFPRVVSAFLGIDLDPSDRFQLHLMQWGIGWSGLAILSWGGYEFFLRKQGPLVLLSVLLLIPVLIPFGFIGFGSDHDAWSVAHVAHRMSREGGYLMSRPPGFPLFEGLARILVPSAGWPGLFIANLCAGIAGCWVWLALPASIPRGKKRLIALLSFGHPLYLLACGTGLDYVWQTVLVTAALVFVARAHTSGGSGATGSLIAGAVSLGLAAGFRITSLALIPAFLIVPLLDSIPMGKRVVRCLLFLGVALATALICELPVLWFFGLDAIRIHPDHPHPIIILYRLIRYVFPPPLLVLLAGSLIALPFGLTKLKSIERALLAMSVAALAIVLPGFFLLPREPGYLTVLIPFLALFCGLLAPKVLHAVCLPALLVWAFLSIPAVRVNPAPSPTLVLKPEAGPLVEESMQRFRSMRRAQQVLSMAPKTRTAAIVGFDWTMLATLRPDWEIAEDGGLESPEFPVVYYEWIDPDSFERMRASDTKILVVGLGGHFTRVKFGYDPLEEGAELWNPKMRFYR